MSEQPQSAEDTAALMSDDDRIAFTQGKRKKLIDEMTASGIPSDKGDKMVLLAALDGMDRVSLANKKIGSQERTGAADRAAAVLIAKLGRTNFGTPSGSPFERPPIEGQCAVIGRDLDTTGLEELEIVPGEMATGLATRNYDDFMADGKAAMDEA